MSYTIYKRAVGKLLSKYGVIGDQDRIKVVQLFDRLLAKDHSIHVDDLRRLCRDVGYDDATANQVGSLYDDLYLIRRHLENSHTLDYWPADQIDEIINGQ
jgi:hypothetical protein